MTDSTKSTWVQFREWFLGTAHHILDLLTPTANALEKAIPANLTGTVEDIIKQAVTIAENTGGSATAKFDAVVSVVIPQLEAIGVTLAKSLLQILISNAVIALGFSAASA